MVVGDSCAGYISELRMACGQVFACQCQLSVRCVGVLHLMCFVSLAIILHARYEFQNTCESQQTCHAACCHCVVMKSVVWHTGIAGQMCQHQPHNQPWDLTTTMIPGVLSVFQGSGSTPTKLLQNSTEAAATTIRCQYQTALLRFAHLTLPGTATSSMHASRGQSLVAMLLLAGSLGSKPLSGGFSRTS